MRNGEGLPRRRARWPQQVRHQRREPVRQGREPDHREREPVHRRGAVLLPRAAPPTAPPARPAPAARWAPGIRSWPNLYRWKVLMSTGSRSKVGFHRGLWL